MPDEMSDEQVAAEALRLQTDTAANVEKLTGLAKVATVCGVDLADQLTERGWRSHWQFNGRGERRIAWVGPWVRDWEERESAEDRGEWDNAGTGD